MDSGGICPTGFYFYWDYLWNRKFAYHSSDEKIYGADYVYVNRQNLVWLNLLTWAVTVYFLLQLYQYVNLFLNNSFDPPSQIIKCLLGITLFFIS